MEDHGTLAVHGVTDVGWDAHTPPNETVDADGRPCPMQPGFGVPDPRAPASREYDHPDVAALRAHLKANNGLHGLEVCNPDETTRAARIFRRDGFVVVRNLLNTEQLELWREASARVLRQILSLPGHGPRKYLTETHRLPHRYSYGTASATRQLLHEPEWAAMIDLPTTTPILREIFQSNDYHVYGAGGDLCLPGAIEYQHLHFDVPEPLTFPEGRLEQARALGINVPAGSTEDELSTRHRQLVLELAAPMITVNFMMSDLTWENGPIRQIPGTQATRQRPPTPEEEPEWMRLSTLVGAKAGDGVFRDNRAWHGATPNLSREVRAMPNVEYMAPWVDPANFERVMPHDIWQTLTPYAQHLCRKVVADPGVWPAGAGVMHPEAAARTAARKD